jgi:Mg2+-importing ATPase
MLLLRLTVSLVVFVLLVNLLFGRPLLESFLFALALAVGLTPEFLPMILTVTLARGAVRMAHEQVIVRRLSAVHDLGAMDILCSDKTGTLTEAQIRLIREVDIAGNDSRDILTWAHVNAAFETGSKAPSTRQFSRRHRRTCRTGARSTRCRSISSVGAYRCLPNAPGGDF